MGYITTVLSPQERQKAIAREINRPRQTGLSTGLRNEAEGPDRVHRALIRGDHRWRREQQRLKLRLFSLFGLLLRCPFRAADGIDWFWRLGRRRLQCRRALPHVFEMPLARHRLDEEVAHRPDQRIDPGLVRIPQPYRPVRICEVSQLTTIPANELCEPPGPGDGISYSPFSAC
jgi:hypothetical protein